MIDGNPLFNLSNNGAIWQNIFPGACQFASIDSVWDGVTLEYFNKPFGENLFANFQMNTARNFFSDGVSCFSNSFNTLPSYNPIDFINFSFNNSFTNNFQQFMPMQSWNINSGLGGNSKEISSNDVELDNTKNAVNSSSWSSFVNINGVRETEINGHKVYACRWSNFSNSQPEWLDLQKYMIEAAEELGLTLVYSDMDRSVSASDAARREKGDIVAPGGKSPHNYGAAVDICLFKDGVAVSAKSALFRQFAELAKAKSGNRIEWGGEWSKKDEEHHFELRDWEKYKNQENMIV